MHIDVRRLAIAISLCSILGAGAAHAQQQGQPQYLNAISANPFGLLFELFNAEYERVMTESSTAGFGGSTFSSSDQRYINADVFWRYYPSGQPMDGWAFGGKIGLTRLRDHGTYFGFGFDANRSWLLGKNNNFYVGIGFGLKRLVGVPENEDLLSFVPTFRLVNIGFAF
jgi:hypothetical protein